MRLRWNAFRRLAASFISSEKAHVHRHLAKAAQWFDKALEVLDERIEEFDRPKNASNTLIKFGSHLGRTARTAMAPLAKDRWTPGAFIVFDFLREFHDPPKVKSETTPVLAVGEIVGLNDHGGVLHLVAESLPGPHGLITPDFWSMGLVAFPVVENATLVSITHRAFRCALSAERQVQLRWRLQPKWGEFPRAVKGHSAEAAAACCVRGLMHHSPEAPGPLLDPSVAITASVADDGETFDERLLQKVAEKTLDAKFQSAIHAGLTAVLVCEGQVPKEKHIHHNADKVDGRAQPGSVLIQPVRTLGDAYDGLLVTSAGIRKYKEKTCDAWDGERNGKWIEKPTPQEFIDASSRERN
jgi:hypothetical protein